MENYTENILSLSERIFYLNHAFNDVLKQYDPETKIQALAKIYTHAIANEEYQPQKHSWMVRLTLTPIRLLSKYGTLQIDALYQCPKILDNEYVFDKHTTVGELIKPLQFRLMMHME